jgi:ligand-binding sensor protein
LEIVSKVRKNSWLFLRRAIKELVSHDDSLDDGLTEETATISTTFIQIAFELSLVAHFLKKDGIHGIVKGSDSSLTEEELLEKFEDNDLNTKSFNSLKKDAIDDHVFLCTDDESLIDEFQKVRNKLVHLNYKFHTGDLYDLKYDLTYFIVKVIIPILSGEYERPSEAISINLDSKDFVKLINFPPYAYQMYKAAKEQSDFVYKCVHCGNESLAVDSGNEHCYSCCSDFTGAGFIDCPYCKSRGAMIYDALNIDAQRDFSIRALCLKCEEDDVVYYCKKCDAEVALEAYAGDGKCHLGYCEWGE